MPIEAEHLNDEELIAYTRETLFDQSPISSGWRRTALEDCMTQIQRRLLAAAGVTAPLPEGTIVVARDVAAPYPALERPDGTTLTKEEAAEFLGLFVTSGSILILPATDGKLDAQAFLEDLDVEHRAELAQALLDDGWMAVHSRSKIVVLVDEDGVAYDAETGEPVADSRPTGEGQPAPDPAPAAEEKPKGKTK